MVNLADLWRILWHRKVWVIGSTLLFIAAAVVYSKLTPPLYSATAQLLIDPRDRQIVSNDVNPSALAPDGGIAQVESQVSVLQSSGVLRRAIAENRLLEDDEFNGSSPFAALFGRLTGLVGGSAPSASAAFSEVLALNAVRRRLAVQRADNAFVIDVTMTAWSPEKAARIANSIVNAYLDDQPDARAEAARGASDALFAHLEEHRERVEAAENAVERFRTENNLVETSGPLVTDQQLAELSMQLSAAQNRTSTLKAQLDQIEALKALDSLPGSLSEALQNPVIASLRQQESTLAQRDADLSSRLGPRHPTLIAVRTQLDQVRRSIDGELQRVADFVRSDYERASVSEAEIAAKLDGLKAQSLAIDQTSVRLRDLQRDLEAVRSAYSSFLVRAQEAREQSSVGSTNARVISEALPPTRKSWPRLSLLLVGAVGGGLGIGVGLAFLREFAAPAILSVHQAERAAGAPVLAVLPTKVVRKGLLPSSLAGSTYLGLADDGEEGPQGPRIVQLVSGGNGDLTRRRLAVHLSSAAAGVGDRVLLVDADGERTGADSQPGLLDVARGDSHLDEVLRRDGDERLSVLAVGRIGKGAADRAVRAAAQVLFSTLSAHYDLVVVDAGRAVRTAPLAASLFGGSICLVAEIGVSGQDEVRRAARLLSASDRPLSGVFLVANGRT